MKADIIKMLKERQGYVSGQELCRQLGVSRTAVWKVIKQLSISAPESLSVISTRQYPLFLTAWIS